MRQLRMTAIAGAVALSFTAPALFAQGAGTQMQQQGGQPPQQEQLRQQFRQADRNQDGYLDPQEAKQVSSLDEQKLQQADRDRDRKLSFDEFQTAMQQGGGTQAGGGQSAQITVQEAQPQVQVQQQEPEVIVRQQEPEVIVRQPEPQVTVKQPEPEVRIQQAQPEVTVQDQGQPQVRVEQGQQAQVQVERPDAQQGQQQPQPQMQQQAQSGEGLMQLRVSELQGRTVYNAEGQELGDIQKVVQSNQDPSRVAAVIEVGGFLGIGSKQVDMPVDQLQLQDDRLIASTSATEQELKSHPEYSEQQYREIQDSGQTLAQIAGGAGASQMAGFGQLDSNGDGQISREEASRQPQLSDRFAETDANRDGQLDRSEFAEFSEQPTEAPPQRSGQPAPGSGSPGGQ